MAAGINWYVGWYLSRVSLDCFDFELDFNLACLTFNNFRIRVAKRKCDIVMTILSCLLGQLGQFCFYGFLAESGNGKRDGVHGRILICAPPV